MKKLNLVLGAFILFSVTACQEEEQPQPTANNNNGGGNNNSELFTQGQGVTDIQGRNYTTIVINGKEWMQENLGVKRFRNGDWMTSALQWQLDNIIDSSAYFDYQWNQMNNTVYGSLYNWYAVNDSRGICPTGWHVATNEDWASLINFLDPAAQGGEVSNSAGGKMKSSDFWLEPNIGATNESGFTALPGGLVFHSVGDGFIFTGKGNSSKWWSATSQDSTSAYDVTILHSGVNSELSTAEKEDGRSIRCVKD
jgi:uncharacterized protein (TIGR02145 family)